MSMLMTKPYKKVYLEITNICNLNCNFCAPHNRPLEFMSEAKFATAVRALEKYTSHLYFHVMGEPLLHPNLNELIGIAAQSFNINLTTNGVLINKLSPELMAKVRKVSISLHCYHANDMNISLAEYLDPIVDFCNRNMDTIIELKLWNEENSEAMLHAVTERLGVAQGNTLRPNLYLGFGKRFKWASENLPRQTAQNCSDAHGKNLVTSLGTVGDGHELAAKHKFCYGLSDQFAVLVDGTVVPCCQDSCSQIPLGNIFGQDLSEILASVRAQNIADGFRKNTAVEQLCLNCDFYNIRRSF